MANISTPDEIIQEVSPYYKKRKELADRKVVASVPSREWKMTYDSSSESLEPVYFWLLDFINPMFGNKVEKIVDTFAATPGGGTFAEISQKAQTMQQMATKFGGDVNTVIKSIQNMIYDLKEFELRLENYKNADSEDENEKQAGLFSLKQIWMDQVDIKKGRGSINMMAQDLNFITLRDAFMMSDSLKSAENMDLNERVKRILTARLEEFLEWKGRSYKELKKRYEIEKTYLKSQVASLKLYTQWAKPYLIAAQKLSMNDFGSTKPDLVSAFNTMVMQLTLFGKSDYNKDIEGKVVNRELPKGFETVNFKRHYYTCMLLDFTFRGIPARLPQGGYTYGGKVDFTVKAYSLNDDEIKLFQKKLDDSELQASFKLIETMTTESLGQLKEDLDKYLKDENKEEEKKKEKAKEADINPFTALLSPFLKKDWLKFKSPEEDKEAKKKKEEEYLAQLEKQGVKSDNFYEEVLRKKAEEEAVKLSFTVYDIYKKSHGMASVPFM